MKLHSVTRAGAFALALCLVLSGCGAASESASTTESTAESAAATDETAVEPSAYDYLADFRFDAIFDDNGYLTGITAADYVTLPADYTANTVTQAEATVAEADIDAYIEANYLADFATTEQVTDRAAEMGDSVNIDFVGSIDGVEFDGGNSGGQGYDLVLGSGRFIDDFEDQIAGHTPGETFDVNATFPEEYGNADLAGKEAVFKTTLNYINHEVTPELTDAWVKENLSEALGFATVDELKDFVRRTLLFNQQVNTVYTQLLDKATFADELPEEVENYVRDMYLYTSPYQYSQMMGVRMEDLVVQSGYESVDAYLESLAEPIVNATQQYLLIQAIAEQTGVKCDDATLDEQFPIYFGVLDHTALNESYGENYVRATLLQNMVMQTVIDQATVTAE